MSSVNSATILGNTGKDIEVRFLNNGNAVANVSVATSRKWKSKETGELQESVEWHNIVFFDRLAEVAGEYIKKGDKIFVRGRLQTRSYEKDGVTRYSTEIVAEELVMLGGKPNDDQQRNPQQRQAEPRREQARQQSPQANQPNSYAAGRGQAQPKPQAQKTGTSFDDMPNDLDEDSIPF